MKLANNPKGNYQYLTGIAPFSSGARAAEGYEIVRATLQNPPPYMQGFELIDRHLKLQERPRQALCGIELRSPEPFTFDGFARFNRGYQSVLADWDIWLDGDNPVARTNVAPEVGAPAEPVLYAFSYTTPIRDSDKPPTFIVAGAAELRDVVLSPEAIVRGGETSADALREKVAFVFNQMQERLDAFELDWGDVTAADIYTVHPIQPLLEKEILEKMGPAAILGVHWFYSRPPVIGLEFEMDIRGIRREIRLY